MPRLRWARETGRRLLYLQFVVSVGLHCRNIRITSLQIVDGRRMLLIPKPEHADSLIELGD